MPMLFSLSLEKEYTGTVDEMIGEAAFERPALRSDDDKFSFKSNFFLWSAGYGWKQEKRF